MTTSQQQTVVIEMIGFEYFKNCVNNGATPEEAKAEMMTEKAQKEIAKRIQEVLS